MENTLGKQKINHKASLPALKEAYNNYRLIQIKKIYHNS